MTIFEHGPSTSNIYFRGEVTFDPNSNDQTFLSSLTLEDWLDTASRDFAMLRIAAVIVSNSEQELEAKLRASPDMDCWLEYLDGVDGLRTQSRALIEVCDCTEARLLIVLKRLAEATPSRPSGRG